MSSEMDIIKTIFNSKNSCLPKDFNEENEEEARLICLNMGIQISSSKQNVYPYQDFLCKISDSNISKKSVDFSSLGMNRTNFVDIMRIFKGGYTRGLNFTQILKLVFVYLRKTFSFIDVSNYVILIILLGSIYLYSTGVVDYVFPLLSGASFGVYEIIMKLFTGKIYKGDDNLNTLELILRLEKYLDFFKLVKGDKKKELYYEKIIKPTSNRVYKILASGSNSKKYANEIKEFKRISGKINKIEEKIAEIKLTEIEAESEIKQQEED